MSNRIRGELVIGVIKIFNDVNSAKDVLKRKWGVTMSNRESDSYCIVSANNTNVTGLTGVRGFITLHHHEYCMGESQWLELERALETAERFLSEFF